ncbi:MAG: phage portal protein, partial [Salaquimonas sp.]
MSKIMRWLRQGSDKTWPLTVKTASALERKSAFNPLIALHGLGEANWCDASYGGLAREGYIKNPIVHRCIRLLSESAAALPLLAYDGDDEMDTHPLLDLLNRPNARQSGQGLFDAVFSSLLICGNAYLSQSELDGFPKELYALRADRMESIRDESGWPIAYDYSVNGRKTRYEMSDVHSPILHLALYNPLDDFEGVSPLASAHMALDIHNSASKWNKALLDNSARPSGALVYGSGESTNLTDEQFERLKVELEEGYTGASRAGRPMLLEGGLDWKQMGFSPKDMDFIEARNAAARDIALAFGVPPMLLGIPGDNTYSNYREANLALWRQTILPMVARVVTAIQNWLGPNWSHCLRLDIDRDRIEA